MMSDKIKTDNTKYFRLTIKNLKKWQRKLLLVTGR